MAEERIKEFLDNDYVNFAVYRVHQRLPHILDTLGQTQRKILYALEQFPESKKFKTAEVYSKVYDMTSYLHGDMSIYNVTENMARDSANNINLLTPEGSFGYRTNKTAAAPRYTSTRFSKLARIIFRKEDLPIMEGQEFEGKDIEPKYLLPIIPVSLINGYSAIAVGFASKFLPRHPIDVIDKMQEALRYKKRKNAKWEEYKISEMIPAYPFYNGNIYHDSDHDNSSAWILTGALHKTKKRNIIEITDLPPEANRETYIKKLKRLQDRGLVKDFTESCVKNTFNFKIKVTPDLWKKEDEELLDILGLVDKASENFTFLNPEGDADNTVIRFETSGEYLKSFIELRQQYYDIRKRYQLDKLNEEIAVLKERIRFIEEVNANEIIITKRKKIDLEKELKEKNYRLIDRTFDHLLGMKMYALTEENVARFKKYIQEKEKEFNKLEKTAIEDIHIQELEELKKAMLGELRKKGLV